MVEQAGVNYGGAINAALRRCLAEDERTIFFGEDVGKPGGVFGVSKGLHAEFGNRVFDTPISETAMIGAGVGAAMMGMRPVVEIMWLDFAMVAFDQIVNQAANVRYVSNGKLSAPLTIRTQQGYLPGSCAQHAQNLEAFLLHVPGIRVCMPTTPQEAYDSMMSAHYCDDPVVVIENRGLYAGPKTEINIGAEPSEIGGSVLRREGSDITIVSWGPIISEVLAAGDQMPSRGIDAEIIEAVWLNPFDWNGLIRSVKKTRRLLVVHEANVTGGFGGEILARVVEWDIQVSHMRRLGLPDVVVPASPVLMNELRPSAESIVAAAVEAIWCRS
ncbi:MAG: alpha-ketoacid dehydrogenase subunit beta [Paracoccaceae bacterium]|nr:alpha-ketoacid dehydrogenase subunit beta [Paracoccaceae bacterium]